MKLEKTKLYLVKGAATVGALAATAQFAAAQSIGGRQISPVVVFTGSLSGLVTNLINIILLVAGVLAVVYLVWGGITYITAGGEAEKATKGRTAITNAVIGIIIIMAAYAIYNAVLAAPTKGTNSVTTAPAGF